MIITPGSNVNVKSPDNSERLAFTRSVLWQGAAGSTSDVTIGFATVRETLTAASDPLFTYSFNLPFDSSLSIQNHAPSVADVSSAGNIVTAEIQAGQEGNTCRITVSSAGKQPVTISGIQSVSSSTTTTRKALSLTGGTVAQVITSAILADALAWSGNVEYYTPANDTAGTPSATCWAADVDLRCLSMDSSRSGAFGQGGGTLVTSLHIVASKHYPFSVGQTVTFSGGQTATITGVAVSDGSSITCDMQVCTLSAAITAPIVPAKIPGAWFDSAITADPYKNRSGEIVGYGVLGLAAHQNGRKFYPMLIQSSTASTVPMAVGGVSYTSVNRVANFRSFNSSTSPHWWTGGTIPDAISGDSGGPIFFFTGTDLVLYSVFTTASSGPSMAGAETLINALIAQADANAGISTGLTVTVAADPTL